MNNKLNHLTRVWLQQHGRGETILAGAVDDFLDAQAERLAEAIGSYTNPTPDLAAKLIDVDAENSAFQKAIGTDLYRLCALGAYYELEASEKSKSFSLTVGISNVFKLPANILASIKSFLTTLEKQPYWRKIQLETTTRLSGVIEAGIDSGDSLHEIIKAVREGLGGENARTRAKAIARTESTGCLNSGHYEARRFLIEDGTISGGSEWLSLDGARDTHAALDGVVTKDQFNVGGHMAPYPGYFGLPAQERVNCRCTTVANFGDEFDE